MKVSFDVKLQPVDLYRFNMYQTYRGVQGWISIILGILSFVMAKTTWGEAEPPYTVMYIVVGLMFWFYMPVSLWFRAKATIKTNAVLAGNLHYEISESGFHVTQGDQEGDLPWNAIYKLISNKRQILIYTTRINAYIIPLEQIGDQYDAFAELAGKKLESYRLRLKK
jgi:predicted membrane channel-forming protein YqfA (hemolysin III family)